MAGVKVNQDTAMSLAAVYSCVKIISETIASLKLEVVSLENNTHWVPNPSHNLYNLLHSEPSNVYSAFTFMEAQQSYLCLKGNCYSRIIRDNNNVITELEILPAGDVKPYLIGREIWYKVKDEKLPTASYNMLHIPAMAMDGVEGLNPIAAQKASLAPAIAAQAYSNSFFANGAHVAGTIEVPGKLKPESLTRLENSFNDKYQGTDKTAKTVFLESGMKYSQIGVNPADAMLIQTMGWKTEDIARMFRVPLPMLQSSKSETYNNNEQSDIFFTKHCIRPWVKRWEAEANRKLIPAKEKGITKVRFNLDSLLRGDSLARANYYRELYNIRAIAPNEIRKLENMAPYEGGDEYGQPLASNSKEIINNEND